MKIQIGKTYVKYNGKQVTIVKKVSVTASSYGWAFNGSDGYMYTTDGHFNTYGKYEYDNIKCELDERGWPDFL